MRACEALRKKGYEAYFHHGAAVSNVTIGTFEPDSIRVIWTETGAQLEILEPKIRALQQQFTWLLLNGNTISFIRRDPRTNRVGSRETRWRYSRYLCPRHWLASRETRRTYLIRIPGYEGSDVLP